MIAHAAELLVLIAIAVGLGCLVGIQARRLKG
jgi:hypothetical protein